MFTNVLQNTKRKKAIYASAYEIGFQFRNLNSLDD